MTEETLAGEQTSTESAAIEETSLVGGSTEEILESEPGIKDEVQEVIEEKPIEENKEIVYEDFKLPDGIVLDEEFSTEFKTIAKELNLNQEQAQKLVDLQGKFTSDYSSKVSDHFKEQVESWKKESIAELGSNYKQELAVVAKAMNNFGSPELRQLLNDTGLGNHKEVVKLFRNIGAKVSEDKMRDSNSGKERTAKTLAEKHYPNTKS